MSFKNHLASLRPLGLRTIAISSVALTCTLPVLSAQNLAAKPAAQPAIFRIDASHSPAQPTDAVYEGGNMLAPNGHRIGVTTRYLTMDGKPWLPVAGEFHFSRVPRAQWDEQLAKMKSSGVNIVAAYVIWIHHEEIKGSYDWSGDRDLRYFVELCQKHGLLFEARIGPWAHAEARNGGFPDWLLAQGRTRENDPAYMASVDSWYHEIGRQLHGLMWKDGGPVIGVQLENEYAKRGPGAGEEHILALKKIALDAGFDVPLYVVTGWDQAVIPQRAVIPVYGGGYPDAPWSESTQKLAPPEVYAFRFNSRVAANMGAMGDKNNQIADDSASIPLPYLTAEIGGGIEETYHRRPVISADDIGAMYPVMLGSGVNMYGTYMYQGGKNPEGKRTTLQESQRTAYPNDLPVKNYDFQAPLGEYGDERPSLRIMKQYQLFLNDFGDRLAPMAAFAPAQMPQSVSDTAVLRASVRADQNGGFLFINNHLRGEHMPERSDIKFDITLPSGHLSLPAQATTIPSDSYAIWPLRQRFGAISLEYATAQLFTRLAGKGPETLVFAGSRGIPAEFSFTAETVRSVTAPGAKEQLLGKLILVSGFDPNHDNSFDVVAADGSKLHILLLSEEDARNAWKFHAEGVDHLLITAADVAIHGSRIALRQRENNNFDLRILPALTHKPESSLPLIDEHNSLHAQAAKFNGSITLTELQKASAVPPVAMGPIPSWRKNAVAMAPEDAAFDKAAKYSIAINGESAKNLHELYLSADFEGDVARLYDGPQLLDDLFFNGQPWQVGLKRYEKGSAMPAFELQILPLRKDAPIYLESTKPVDFGDKDQVATPGTVRLIPEYQLELNTSQK